MNHCLFWPTWCGLKNVKWSNSRQFNPNFKIKTQKTHKQQSMRPLTCYKYFCQIYLFFGYLSIMANLVRPVWGVRLHFWTKWIWFLESASKKYAIHMCWWFFENLSPPYKWFLQILILKKEERYIIEVPVTGTHSASIK